MPFKKHYQLFLNANKDVQHYASHSHHYWPDVTREAMLRYWDDSAKLVDDKWDYFFNEKIPAAQKLIAEVLNLPNPKQIVFAPNTHEFVTRILSCLPKNKQLRILTTDSEFYSFDRQINRLAEDKSVFIEKVASQPFANFTERFSERIKSGEWDLIFLSHVFFNSGVVVERWQDLVQHVSSPETLFVVDGYHGFMALPTDLSKVASRIFYVAGSYKYAQGGEGCCFMTVPNDCSLRPANTGWFAGFSSLTAAGGEVTYSQEGYRFAGSTMDFSALYRLEAVLKLFKKENITVEKIHQHVQRLQTNFLHDIANWKHPYAEYLNEKNLFKNKLSYHGHFLTFALLNASIVEKIHSDFVKQGIKTDCRGTAWRFGFGLYQDDHINLGQIR